MEDTVEFRYTPAELRAVARSRLYGARELMAVVVLVGFLVYTAFHGDAARAALGLTLFVALNALYLTLWPRWRFAQLARDGVRMHVRGDALVVHAEGDTRTIEWNRLRWRERGDALRLHVPGFTLDVPQRALTPEQRRDLLAHLDAH